MKKFQIFLPMIIICFISSACQLLSKEFNPKEDSLFKISFSYPVNWILDEDFPPFDEITEEPPPAEVLITNHGFEIGVYKPDSPKDLMQEWMEGYLEAVNPMLIEDRLIQIDGYDARWLIVLYPTQNSLGSSIDETIYLLVEDRFYILGMDYDASVINTHEHEQFVELIESIDILP